MTLTVKVSSTRSSSISTCSAICWASFSEGALTQISAIMLQSAASAPVTVIEPIPVSTASVPAEAIGEDRRSVLSYLALEQPPI